MQLQAERQDQRPPPTHGSDQRPPRELWHGLQTLDMAELSARLGAEPAFGSDGRNSRTIHDDGVVRVGVSVVAAGREIGAERSDRYVAMSIVEGTGRLSRGPDDWSTVNAGQVAIIAPGSSWTFEATELTVFIALYWAS